MAPGRLLLALGLVAAARGAQAASSAVPRKPPMGFSSWNYLSMHVSAPLLVRFYIKMMILPLKMMILPLKMMVFVTAGHRRCLHVDWAARPRLYIHHRHRGLGARCVA